ACRLDLDMAYHSSVGCDRRGDQPTGYATPSACFHTPEITITRHAKPWAECTDDAERLDAFNGFLLAANLDALFDRFLISFDGTGRLLISDSLAQGDLDKLGIHQGMALRWLAVEHQYYLRWHRERFFLRGL
ncbi:HNH endonuclease, partial [Stutzerimonas stutzeri]|uniref:HNH endonuclease n=1 Tax=Stutzerimonas stutzeri TaxID=316 RepID=UPI0034D6451C